MAKRHRTKDRKDRKMEENVGKYSDTGNNQIEKRSKQTTEWYLDITLKIISNKNNTKEIWKNDTNKRTLNKEFQQQVREGDHDRVDQTYEITILKENNKITVTSMRLNTNNTITEKQTTCLQEEMKGIRLGKHNITTTEEMQQQCNGEIITIVTDGSHKELMLTYRMKIKCKTLNIEVS